MSPFLNKVLRNLTAKEFKVLVVIMLSIYSLVTMFSLNSLKFSDLDFFLVMYTLGAFLKLHGESFLTRMGNVSFFLFSFSMMILSVIGLDLLGFILNKPAIIEHATFFQRENTPLSIVFAVSAFAFFSKLNIQSSWINYISKSVLGIYLIHDNRFLRPILWNSVLPFTSGISPYVHFLLKIALIFVICLLVDVVRREAVERWYKGRFN